MSAIPRHPPVWVAREGKTDQERLTAIFELALSMQEAWSSTMSRDANRALQRIVDLSDPWLLSKNGETNIAGNQDTP